MTVPDRSLALPSGTVTFLFTDVEGSTRLWSADTEAMSASWPEVNLTVCDATSSSEQP